MKPPWWIPGLMLVFGTSFIVFLTLMFMPRAPMSTSISPAPTAAEVRMRSIEKRMSDLEVEQNIISFRMRLERRVNDEESQRRVDAIVARANAARDAARDR